MTELELLQALQATTGLIVNLPDKAQQVERVADFTRRAAWVLKDRGWGNVRKTDGANVRGLSIDKILNGVTGSVRDLCTNSDSDDPALAWNDAGMLDPRVSFVAAQPPPDAPPGPQPQPDPPPVPAHDELVAVLLEVVALVTPLIDATQQLGEHVVALSERLADVQQHGVKVHL